MVIIALVIWFCYVSDFGFRASNLFSEELFLFVE